MIKKILLGTLLVGTSAILVVGAINRTMVKTEGPVAQGGDHELAQAGLGGGYGRNAAANPGPESGVVDPNLTGRGQGSGNRIPDPLLSASETGTRNGGQGWGSGVLGAEDPLLTEGLATSQSGGWGRSANSNAAAAGEGAAEVQAWLTLDGRVVSLDAESMLVALLGGEVLEVTGRAWRFAQENGFTAQPGDDLTLVGFYEGEELEIGQITNHASGSVLALRGETGRPLWAGRQ